VGLLVDALYWKPLTCLSVELREDQGEFIKQDKDDEVSLPIPVRVTYSSKADGASPLMSESARWTLESVGVDGPHRGGATT